MVRRACTGSENCGDWIKLVRAVLSGLRVNPSSYKKHSINGWHMHKKITRQDGHEDERNRIIATTTWRLPPDLMSLPDKNH